MLVLHTTEKLRKRWKLKLQGPDILPGPQPFRHWQANTFPAVGKTWVLFLEATTYWGVLVPFGSWKSVVSEFHRRVRFELVGQGASPDLVHTFEEWGSSQAILPSLDRRTLGISNTFAFYASDSLNAGDALEHALQQIRECPTGALAEGFPHLAFAARVAAWNG